jgi:aspartate/methionine/tyrosine aminotransferase
VISDEVFFDFVLNDFQSDRVSLASNAHTLTFTLGGISKTLGLPQMKLSWIVVTGPEALRAKAIERLEIISDTYLSAGTPVQHALPGWLKFREKIQTEILTRLTANYNFLLASFSSTGSARVLKTEGGWNAVLKLPSSLTDEEWAVGFLEKDGVLVHPGYLFDFEEGSFAVLSLLVPPDIFREAVQRLASRLAASAKNL